MTVKHWVLLKLQPSISDDNLEVVYEGFQKLSKINGVISVSYGAVEDCKYSGYNDRTNGYTHVLCVVLNDINSLISYDKDEYHNSIKKHNIIPFLDKSVEIPILAVDWEDHGEITKPTNNRRSSWTLIAVAALSIGAFMILKRGGFSKL